MIFDPAGYSIAIWLFLKCLGVIYIIAYLPFFFQIEGLIGSKGILPVQDYLSILKVRFGKKAYSYVPTLLWLNSSNRALYLLLIMGLLFASLLIAGVYPPLMLLGLYIVHLSLTNAGQDFLRFGWETYLMEVTVSAFLTVATSPFNYFGWLNLNFLLFRFHIGAGASKLLSRDENWANLTALCYHYHTQPIANLMAWYFDKLPLTFHKLSALGMFYIELIVPFFIFMPPDIRLLVFIQLVGLQISIWFTGNLSYLNHLTAVSCIILLHNKFLEPFLSPVFAETTSSLVWYSLISLLAFAYLICQILCFCFGFSRSRRIAPLIIFFEPFHILYPHGIFAVMTTKRYEVVVEGSRDGVAWQEYEFYYKPGPLNRRPKRIAPYQPRLDWQAWFLPFRPYYFETWFQQFLQKLLEGEPSVLRLLKGNPFGETPPLFVRALLYEYEFTTNEEKKKTGNWWKRSYRGIYAYPIMLQAKGITVK